MAPIPPFLMIRRGRSFWVERGSHQQCRTTLSALADGHLDGAICVDASGGCWPVLGTVLPNAPSLLDRILPWRRVLVRLRLGERKQLAVSELAAVLNEIIRQDSDFTDHLAVPRSQLSTEIAAATDAATIIQVAGTA